MSSSQINYAFVSINEEIKRSGMNRGIYERIANEFQDLHASSSDFLLGILKHFVSFQGEVIYANEIRNFLKENNSSLFNEYGSRFIHCKGCLEVFGIEPADVISYNFKVEEAVRQKTTKKYDIPKARKRTKNNIKKQAKSRAASNFKARLDEKQERKRKNEEINEMIRKQNI